MKLDMGKYPPQWVRIDSINRKDKRFQCRVKMNEAVVKWLMGSLKEHKQRNPVIIVEMPDGQRLVIDGDHRLEALVRLGETMVLVCIIPLADLGPDPDQAGYESSVITNKAENTLSDRDNLSISGRYYKEGKSLHQIADELGIDRKKVRWNILIYKAGPEALDAAINGLLPIIKTAEYLDKDNGREAKQGGGGKLPHPPTEGSENNKKDNEISAINTNNSEGSIPPVDAGAAGGGVITPPPQGDSEKLDIAPERRDKVVEALKSANPKEAIKKLLAASSPLVGEGGGEGPASSAGMGVKPAEFKIVKSSKGITIPATHFPVGATTDDMIKALKSACQKYDDDQSQAETEKAQKEAEAKKAADAAEAARLEEELKVLESSEKIMKEAGQDASAIRQQIDTKNARLKELVKPARKTKGEGRNKASKQIPLSSAPPSTEIPVGEQPLLPPTHLSKGESTEANQQTYPGQHDDNLKKAVDAGLLGEKGMAVLEFKNKMIELTKLQQSFKAAGSEEDKARLKAEIEKKTIELEAIKQTLNGGKP